MCELVLQFDSSANHSSASRPTAFERPTLYALRLLFDFDGLRRSQFRPCLTLETRPSAASASVADSLRCRTFFHAVSTWDRHCLLFGSDGIGRSTSPLATCISLRFTRTGRLALSKSAFGGQHFWCFRDSFVLSPYRCCAYIHLVFRPTRLWTARNLCATQDCVGISFHLSFSVVFAARLGPRWMTLIALSAERGVSRASSGSLGTDCELALGSSSLDNVQRRQIEPSASALVDWCSQLFGSSSGMVISSCGSRWLHSI